jgi:flavorubredoxin
MTRVDEIAPEIYRLSTFIPEAGLEFNQFLVRDEEPVLIHTGMKGLFPFVREALTTLIDPAKLRWVTGSHFEADEFGAINEWLALTPGAEAMASEVGVITSLMDYTGRLPRVLHDNETLILGSKRLRFIQTPHVPHGWDAGLYYEETSGTLFCSDLLSHGGNKEPLGGDGVVEQAAEMLKGYKNSPWDYITPYSAQTERSLQRLIDLQPCTLAIMHGSSYQGDGARALRELSHLLKEFSN